MDNILNINKSKTPILEYNDVKPSLTRSYASPSLSIDDYRYKDLINNNQK